MGNKSKDQDLGLGDWIVPVIDVLSILVMEALKLIFKGISFGINHYILKRERVQEVKKIERKELKDGQ